MLRLTHLRVAGLAAVALALAASGCGSGGDGKKGIAFGVLAPLSGPHAAAGRQIVDGAKLAAARLNVRGGLIGQPVRVVAIDDHCTASGGHDGAVELLDERNLAGVLGGVCAPAARAAARALGPAKVPFVVTSANSPSILSPKLAPSTYMLGGTPYQQSLAVAHWIALINKQRLAAVVEPGQANKSLLDQLVAVTSPTPAFVSQQTAPAGESDMAQTARVTLLSHPDIVYWAGSADGGGRFVAALRAAGYKGTFVASSRSASPAFIAAAGPKGAEGAFVVSPARPGDLPDTKPWAAGFRKTYGGAPTTDAMQAYDGLRVLSQAVIQTGMVDHARNTAALPGLNFSFKTFLGNVQFALDHTIQNDNTIILGVHDGKFFTENDLRTANG